MLRIKSLTDELEDAEDILMTLVRTIEAKDRYTLGHADRVGRYAVALGRALGCNAFELETLRKGGVLHDIGKLGIPDVILQKAGPLDDHEWEVMRKHPLIGCEICQRLKSLDDILPIIRHHHECLDGTGYPDGKRAVEIEVGAHRQRGRHLRRAHLAPQLQGSLPRRESVSNHGRKSSAVGGTATSSKCGKNW